MAILKIEKVTQILKNDVFDVNCNGMNCGRIKYFHNNQKWGFYMLTNNQFLDEKECLELHEKLKELNNATI